MLSITSLHGGVDPMRTLNNAPAAVSDRPTLTWNVLNNGYREMGELGLA